MKRILAAALVALLILVPLPAFSLDPGKILKSVQPIQGVFGTGELRNFCSSASINQQKHYWLTAAHCVEEDGYLRYVGGDQIKVLMRDVVNDVAVFTTVRVFAPALKLAKEAPKTGDIAMIAGYPFGILDPFVTFGKVISPSAQLCEGEEEFCGERRFLFVDAMAAPGNSGSAIMNSKGELISVLQIGYGRVFGPGGGAPYAVLKQYASYFEKR